MDEKSELQKEVALLRQQNKELRRMLRECGHSIAWDEYQAEGGCGASKEHVDAVFQETAGQQAPPLQSSERSQTSGENTAGTTLHAAEAPVSAVKDGRDNVLPAGQHNVAQGIAANAFRELEPLIRLLINANPDCVAVVAEDGTLLYLNSNGAEHFQQSVEDLEGGNLLQMLPEGDICEEIFRQALSRDISLAFHEEIQGRKIECFASAVTLSDMRVVLMSQQDVTGKEASRNALLQAKIILEEQVTSHSTELREQARQRLKMEEELLREQGLMRAILDADPNGICVFNADGTLRLVNVAMRQAFQAEENTPLDVLFEHEQLQHLVGDTLQHVIESGQPLSVERRIEDELGTYQWFETVAVPLPLIDSQQCVLFIAMNVTARKVSELVLSQAHSELEERVKERTGALAELNRRLVEEVRVRMEAEEQIRESEERYRGLFFANQAVKLLIDCSTGQIVEANSAAGEMYGCSREELLSRTIFDFYDYPEESVRQRMEIVQKQGNLAFSTQQIMADGTPREVEIYSGKIDSRDGPLIFSIVHDVTERKRTEKLLAEQRRHLDALLNSSIHAALLIGVDGTIIAHNKAAAKLMHPTLSDLTGKSIFRYAQQEYVPLIHRAIERGIEQKGPIRLNQFYADRYWDTVWYPVAGVDGETVAISVYAEDITDKKQADARMRKLSARVLSAQEDERQRIGRELHDSTAQTLSGIKFMVEAQLAAMKNRVDMKSAGASAMMEQWEKIVTILQGAIVELRRIIMDLRPTVLDDLGLVSALRWLQHEVMTMYPSIVIVVRAQVDERLFSAEHKSVLFRIAQEALGNAGKHSGADQVLMTLSMDEEACVLQIDDDGCGLPANRKEFTGIGLESMRERLELVSGALYLGKSDLGGASIQAVVPLHVNAPTSSVESQDGLIKPAKLGELGEVKEL